MAKALRARAIRSFYNVAHVALCISYLFYYIKSCALCQDLAVFFHKSAIFGGGGREDLGALPRTLLRGLLKEKSPKNLQDLHSKGIFALCFSFVQILGVAGFRATNSGCSEPHSASEMRTAAATCCLAFSPLPDRSGRKLVDDRDGTTHVSFRFESKIHSYGECKFIPPHQSLTRQLPPEGKPSLHCANTANVAYMADISNISLSCGLPLRFTLVALSCSAKGILQKGFPLGWKLSRKRLMRGG